MSTSNRFIKGEKAKNKPGATYYWKLANEGPKLLQNEDDFSHQTLDENTSEIQKVQEEVRFNEKSSMSDVGNMIIEAISNSSKGKRF